VLRAPKTNPQLAEEVDRTGGSCCKHPRRKSMAADVTHRLEELKREFERQDAAWAEVEKQLTALSHLGIAIKRVVLDDLDDALATTSRSARALQHQFC
jgi:hypothetical protein